jgi:hypothetical protein
MPCYHPIQAYRSRVRTKNGKLGIVFSKNEGYSDLPVTIPCGGCIGCRLERSRQWAVRCMHEASLYDDNCFITLTYDDDNLPVDGSLNKTHFQKFMKRLRKRSPGKTIRYYHCGEYGEENSRPHYHACLFNYDFPDKVQWKKGLFVSEKLAEVWPYGFSTIGHVTFESAAYVARYVMKKVTGKAAEDHYESVNAYSGEIYKIQPEYTTMSRRPGIGKGWYDQFKEETYNSDSVIVNSREVKPPKYYDSLYELENTKKFEIIKKTRKQKAIKYSENNTQERLIVREKVKKAQLDKLKRVV